jgi:hypothetical protein
MEEAQKEAAEQRKKAATNNRAKRLTLSRTVHPV